MVKRISHGASLCGVARPLDAIGDGWSLLIVRDAFDGLRRFGEFQRSLGLAKNILAARLRHLVAHDILEAVPAEGGGAHLDYVLTKKGRALFPVVVALRQWGEGHGFEAGGPHVRLADRRSGRELRRLEPQASDGRAVKPDDVTLHFPPGA